MDDIAWLLLMFYQCLMYVCCSSPRRPWWCLVAVVLAGLHCRTFQECQAASLAAACALALSDDTVPSVFLMLHVFSAVVAPMFPPKRKRQSNLNAFNAARQGTAATTGASTRQTGGAGATQEELEGACWCSARGSSFLVCDVRCRQRCCVSCSDGCRARLRSDQVFCEEGCRRPLGCFHGSSACSRWGRCAGVSGAGRGCRRGEPPQAQQAAAREP